MSQHQAGGNLVSWLKQKLSNGGEQSHRDSLAEAIPPTRAQVANRVFANDQAAISDEDIFISGAYVQEYYSSLGHENAEVGKFLFEAAKDAGKDGNLRILDAGCGPTVLYWSSFFPGDNEVHAFDINPVNIAENRRRIAEAQCGVADAGLLEAAEQAVRTIGSHKSARFHLADKARQIASLRVADLTKKWPFPDDQFDLVTSCFALEQLPDWDAFDWALNEARRVLRPGGRIALTLGSQGTHWNCDHQSFNTLYVTPANLKEHLTRAGLTVHASREIDSADTNWRDQGYCKVLLALAVV